MNLTEKTFYCWVHLSVRCAHTIIVYNYMAIIHPELPFDQRKPFYSLVVSYIVQINGLEELRLRGLLSGLDAILSHKFQQQELYSKVDDFKLAIESAYGGSSHTGWTGTYRFPSRAISKGLDIEIKNLPSLVFSDTNCDERLKYFKRMTAGSLLILAHEITEIYHNKDPLWEFVRHCRNAAAHKGYFNLLHGEPKRIAKWRTLEITKSLNGKSLFADSSDSGFLELGDVLFLLWDIEQAYPNIE